MRLIVGIYGEAVGLILIGTVVLKDLVWTGISGMFKDFYRIGPAGVCVIIVGLGLILLSKHIDRELR